MRFVRLHALLVAVCLAVPAAGQTSLDVGSTITVELLNGDRLTGVLEEADGPRLVLLHDVFGRIEIPRASVQPSAPPEPPASVDPVSPWSGSFDLALTGSEGNTDTQNFRTSVEAKHEDEDSVDTFSLWYRRNTTDNDTTEQKTFAQYRHEWKLEDSKWGSFVQGTWETDRFADYDSRAGVAGGASYRFNEGPVHAVKGRLGAGVSRKYGVDDPDVDENSYEGLVGLDWRWKISEVSDFNFTTDLYPGIKPAGEHRTVSKAALTTKPDPDSSWFLKLGVDHFHDTQPGAGKKPNDWNYYLGFGRFF